MAMERRREDLLLVKHPDTTSLSESRKGNKDLKSKHFCRDEIGSCEKSASKEILLKGQGERALSKRAVRLQGLLSCYLVTSVSVNDGRV